MFIPLAYASTAKDGARVVGAAFSRGNDEVGPDRGYHFEVFTAAGTFGPAYPEMEGGCLVLNPYGDEPIYLNPAEVVAIKVVAV